ncbi:F-box/FBD/LRR-repeat protein At1g13570 isoform X2 [Beta vulgaris subsp. vulgaris]|uniref:F-box/FBD/LRR-repeat protein At1g13570 isoform X2 n=1 Tax=Beta vulgaris subsp. vulgaris TaxID=3555 RepID=UPI002036E799|nr:F-box/FBD/LRR-repeat protein At1g13570 isoform X2 [Beta vulgaris subsp. vulgaris]
MMYGFKFNNLSTFPMASSSKSPKQPKFGETTQDMISSMPTEVTDKIMKRLPLKTAAKMSVLSRKWRRNWLSHRYLVFDRDFWEEQRKNGKIEWHKISNIISNILFLHNGPVQVFHLYIPGRSDNISLNLSPWLFFLSRIGVKKIRITNGSNCLTIPSHIYACKELVKLSIQHYVVETPPCEFKGFAHLRNIELVDVEFKHETMKSLIASCPQLTVLVLQDWYGMDNVVIDAPRLEVLTIRGEFMSLAFENVSCVKSVTICLNEEEDPSNYIETIDAIKILASSTELQCLQFGGRMSKLLAAGYAAQPFTLAFNHLHRLSLTDFDLSDFGVFCFTFSMLQSCPSIKDLHISLDPNKRSVKHKFDYNKDYKLRHLLKVEITGITGSSVEFKLIEYVLATSVVLEKLLFKCAYLDPSSELKVSRVLLQLPRASPKAKLVCMEQ